MSISIQFCFRIKDDFDIGKSYEAIGKFLNRRVNHDKDFAKWKVYYENLENTAGVGYLERNSNAFEHYVDLFASDSIQYQPEKMAYFIGKIKELYSIMKTGGFGRTEEEEVKEQEIFGEDYKTFKVWSATLFSPEEVRKIGRKKILESPCETIEELKDGAILMMINKNSLTSNYEQRKKLREYLGVK